MGWSIRPATRFREVVADWDRLNDAAGGSPILGAAFVARALEMFGTGQELLATRTSPTGIEAMCVLQPAAGGSWRTFQASQLPLGAWAMDTALSYAEALEGLFDELPGVPLLVAITQQDPDIYRRPCAGGRMDSVDYIRTGWIAVEPSFSAYWRGRSRHFRQNVRTQNAKLMRLGILATVEETSDPGSVAEVIERYGSLESAGWKGRCGVAVTADNVQGHFYRAVLEDCCRLGTGRIYALIFNDRTVAIDLCIESRGCHVLLKTTYDEQLQGFSPSTLLKWRVYERLFDRQAVHRIEYFGPYMEWTSRWTSSWRRLFHVNAFRSSTVRFIRDRLSAARRGLRQAGVERKQG